MALVQIPTLFGDDVAPEYTEPVDILGPLYTATVRWSSRRACWTLDLLSPDGEAMITGQAIVLNVDLLTYCPPKLRPRGVLVATWVSDDETAFEAGERDLGERVKLYHYERAADLDPQPPTEPPKA